MNVTVKLEGKNLKRNQKPFDEFSRHEVYDRASIVLDLFCASVAEHPVVVQDKALSAEAERVSDAIYRFYNMAAIKLMPAATTEKRKRKAKTAASPAAGKKRKRSGL